MTGVKIEKITPHHKMSLDIHVTYFIIPLPFQANGVLSLPASVCPSTLSCPHDNSSQIWARITKLEPNMHHGILSAGIENGGRRPWPSMTFWPFWLRILGNLACLHHNSSQISAGITKFASNTRLGILTAGIEKGEYWPWPWQSFGHFDSEFKETAFIIALIYWAIPAKGC